MPKIAEIEFTPNPNAKRFVLKEELTFGLPKSYDTAAQAKGDPLAEALFAIPHVSNVYYVGKFLTVTQDGGADWRELERSLAVPIRAAEPAKAEAAGAAKQSFDTSHLSAEDQERLAQIDKLLDDQVRPSLMMDGGGLEIWGFDGKKLQIHYQGACGSCPSSLTATLFGIEGLVRTVAPDVELVAV
jgi:Fe-S cluster biogenesis protein NfuA